MLNIIKERNKILEKEILKLEKEKSELEKDKETVKNAKEAVDKLNIFNVDNLQSIKNFLDKKCQEIQSSWDIAGTGQFLTTEEKWSLEEENAIKEEIQEYQENSREIEEYISSVEEMKKALADSTFEAIVESPQPTN